MKRKKEAAPTVEAEEEVSPEYPETPEGRKAKLYRENEEIVLDPIFEQIKSSIDEKWNELKEQDKIKVLDAFEELLVAIRNYDDSYRKLKGISSYKLSDTATAEILNRHNSEISDADRRERELHNRFLDTVNILSRRMKELGLDNSWRANEMIYPLAGDGEPERDMNRRKVKRWMFRVFSES